MFMQPIQQKTVELCFGPQRKSHFDIQLIFELHLTQDTALEREKINPDKSNEDSYSASVHTHAKTDTVNV